MKKLQMMLVLTAAVLLAVTADAASIPNLLNTTWVGPSQGIATDGTLIEPVTVTVTITSQPQQGSVFFRH